MQKTEIIDAVSHAAAAGQAAAAQIADLLGPAQRSENNNFDAARWASLGGLVTFEGDDSGERAVQTLARYVVGRAEAAGAEQLYRKARELGIHQGSADFFAAQPHWVQLAYGLFARTVRDVADYLLIANAQQTVAGERRPRAALSRWPLIDKASETLSQGAD